MTEDRRFAPPADLPDQIRCLLRGRGVGMLGTLGQDGAPYVSLVTVATREDGVPLLLLSRLADHTRNLDADPRLSLMIEATAGYANPQQGARVTLQGRAVVTTDPADRARFLGRHPGAALYADFPDFRFFRLEITATHWVGGFARAHWSQTPFTLPPAALPPLPSPDDLSALLPTLLTLAGADATIPADPDAPDWRISERDPDGFAVARGNTVLRFTFSAPCFDRAAMETAIRGGKVRYWRN